MSEFSVTRRITQRDMCPVENHMKLNLKCALLVCISFCTFAIIAQGCFAQTFSSSIAGTVTDPSGSVVPGTNVHLLNMSTHDTREAVASAAGTYRFDNLLPGTYQIAADASGFKAFVQSNMILPASTAATVNIPLSLGGVEQKVQVTAEAVLLDTETANNTATLDTHLITSLPNSYRNPLNFVFALAGTTEGQAGLTSRSGSFDQNGSMFGLTGGRTGNAQILIDGAPSTAVDWGGLFVAPNNDAVQEQQIVQNVYDAQYERSGSGVVTLITKSGSQNFHGTVYDYFRNSGLDANSWYNNRNDAPRGLLHRNQFGVTFGGPISRSRHLFFFAAYEGLRQPKTDATTLTVPTDAERNGDFSHTYNPDGSLQVIYNPFSTHQVTDSLGHTYYTRDPFPGNIIPSNLLNSVGQNIVNLYPQANRPSEGLHDSNNYFKQGSGSTVNDKFDWRIDWAQSEKNRMFARMSDRVRQKDNPACFFCNGADENSTNEDHGFQVVLNDTYTPSPTWVIDGYAAYGRWYETQAQTGHGKADASAIGLSPSLFQAPLLPLVHSDLYATLGTDYSSFNHYVRSNVTWLGNVTKQFTRHTLKFGANYGIAFMNNRQDNPGRFDFGRSFTSCEPGPGDGPCQVLLSSDTFNTGNGIASMLVGTGSGYSDIQMDPAMSLHTIGLFIQDQWRATDRMTITAGLRYENQRPATERFNRLTYFDKTAVNPLSSAVGFTVPGAFEYANSNNRFAWGPDNRNFAPRLGIAYKLTDKLVARVGAGLFYAPASAMISFDSPGQYLGFTSRTNWIGSVDSAGYIPTNLVSDPFPNGLVPPVGNKNGAMTQVGDGAGQIWPKGKHSIGYTEQWSIDLQYQIAKHAVVEAGYTGTRGRRLMYGNPDLNANQLPTQLLALGRDALSQQVDNPYYGVITDPNSPLSGEKVPYNQLLRPFPQFTYLNYARSLPGGSSAYDALNLKFTKQFSNGLSMISSYSWSKALDNGSEDFVGWAIGGLWRDAYNTKLDYAISMHDVPQSFVTAFVYQMPFGRGKRWGSGSSGIINEILGSWEVSGVVRLTSGLPLLAPFYSSNSLWDFGFPGQGVPNLVGNPKPAHQTTDNWINPDAFAEPADMTYGNMPARMTQLRESATKNVDLGVAKSFGPERFRAQFRAEFLNAFNHPFFGGTYYGGWGSNIDLCIDCGNLGKVYGTRNDPRNVQLSLKFMF